MSTERLTPSFESVTQARNSRIRELTVGAISGVAERLHQSLPDFSPDHVTFLGTVGVALGAILAEYHHRKKPGEILSALPSLGVLMGASLMDAVDGSLARLIAQENPESVYFSRGQVVDACADRTQEFIMALSRAVSAHHRQDKAGEVLAFMAGLTSSLPGIFRALTETLGATVPETGKDALGFLGTRAGRALTGIAATVFPEIKDMPLQVTLDAITIIANLRTTCHRFQAWRQADNVTEQPLPQEDREKAEIRAKALMNLSAIIFGTSLLAYKLLQQKKK